jgi:uncharacterized cupredoxin-like copper-binding protein
VNLRGRWWLVISMVVGLALVAASCGGDDDGTADGGTADGGTAADNTVAATLADYTITLDQDSAPAGDVTFDVTNDAEQIHEFVVFQTDLAEDALPTDENGDVDESGEGVTLVDEIEDIEGGSTQSLDVTLDAASYVVICNLPGHYSQGMHASLTVE